MGAVADLIVGTLGVVFLVAITLLCVGVVTAKRGSTRLLDIVKASMDVARPYIATGFTIAAMLHAASGSLGDALANAVCAAVWWLSWWNGGGKKLTRALLGRVRDLGHRLVIVPELSPARA
jgi:hypothetical protein